MVAAWSMHGTMVYTGYSGRLPGSPLANDDPDLAPDPPTAAHWDYGVSQALWWATAWCARDGSSSPPFERSRATRPLSWPWDLTPAPELALLVWHCFCCQTLPDFLQPGCWAFYSRDYQEVLVLDKALIWPMLPWKPGMTSPTDDHRLDNQGRRDPKGGFQLKKCYRLCQRWHSPRYISFLAFRGGGAKERVSDKYSSNRHLLLQKRSGSVGCSCRLLFLNDEKMRNNLTLVIRTSFSILIFYYFLLFNSAPTSQIGLTMRNATVAR